MSRKAEGANCPAGAGAARRRGEGRAEFDRLVRRYRQRAYDVAYRMTGNAVDAEDLTQEAFVRAFRFFGKYRTELPFDKWLYKIMSNRFIDLYRRDSHGQRLLWNPPPHFQGSIEGVVRQAADADANPERIVLAGVLEEHLERALMSLPRRYQQTVLLADIEGLSYAEIGAVMRCSPGTVRSRLNRGRTALRAQLAAVGALPADSTFVPRPAQ